MRAGAGRSVIAIQRQIQMGVTAHNAPIMVWADWCTGLFAELEVVRGREHFNQLTLQRYSEEVYKFTVRYELVVGIEATMQVVDEDGSRYDIKAILGDKARRVDVVIECVLQDGILGAAALLAYLKVTPPAGISGQVYAGFTISAKGGTVPYSFALTSGTLPAGLSLDAATGIVSGTPTAPGTASDRVFTVSDAAGTTAELPPIDIIIS